MDRHLYDENFKLVLLSSLPYFYVLFEPRVAWIEGQVLTVQRPLIVTIWLEGIIDTSVSAHASSYILYVTRTFKVVIFILGHFVQITLTKYKVIIIQYFASVVGLQSLGKQ